MPSLRALECLVAIADTGSITQAARLLQLSQPAVSHQLSMLEREAQTILFLREARGLKLTPAGRAAVGDARQAIDIDVVAPPEVIWRLGRGQTPNRSDSDGV